MKKNTNAIKEILKEDNIEVSSIKPSKKPNKPAKYDFNEENKNNDITNNLIEGRDLRLKAYKMLNKEKLNKKSKTNIINEPLNGSEYLGNFIISNKSQDKSSNIKQNNNLSLINQFDQYYNNKFKPQENNISNANDILNDHTPNLTPFKVNLSYVLGANIKKQPSICFHKKEKWVGYLNKNLIIIENFNEGNKKQKQHIISDSRQPLDGIKLSTNGKILYSFSIFTPIIYFYNADYDNSEFKLINKISINHHKLSECEISPQNNLCLVISNNIENESYISILDFNNNEILMTTISKIYYTNLKWNPYLTNLEFSSLSSTIYTFWRVQTSDASLQYQYGDFDHNLLKEENIQFTCMEYTPPLSVNSTILLLVGLTNTEIWGIDTKTNSVNIKFNYKAEAAFTNIICSLKYACIISGYYIQYYKMPVLKEISYDNFNIFSNKEQKIEFDSDICCLDIDLLQSEGLLLTTKGVLYCFNLNENLAVRLVNYIDDKSEILQVKIINRENQFYSLRKIDYNNLEIEQISPDIKENQYFIITAHKGGNIKVWSVPEYFLSINFDTPTEEILYFDTTPNDKILICSYNSGILRFFDLNLETFIGKYKSISGQPYKFVKFLPDGLFILAVDMNNTIFLIKVDNFEPLLVQIHQLFNVTGDILEFKLNPLDNYNKFLFNIQNVYLQIYNRKFTNILKNLSYDGSIPVFYLQDKFHIDEFLKNSEQTRINSYTSNTNNSEFFYFEFSPMEKEIVFILSQARKLLIIRNYELHIITKILNFSYVPVNFCISPNSAFLICLFQNCFKISEIHSETSFEFNLLSKVKNASVSINGKLLVIYSNNSLFFYHIKF